MICAKHNKMHKVIWITIDFFLVCACSFTAATRSERSFWVTLDQVGPGKDPFSLNWRFPHQHHAEGAEHPIDLWRNQNNPSSLL